MWEVERSGALLSSRFSPRTESQSAERGSFITLQSCSSRVTSYSQSFQFSNCWGFFSPSAITKKSCWKVQAIDFLRSLLTTPRKLLHFECILPTFPVFSVVLQFSTQSYLHDNTISRVSYRRLTIPCLKKKKNTPHNCRIMCWTSQVAGVRGEWSTKLTANIFLSF